MSGVSKLVDENLQKQAAEDLKNIGKIGEVANKLKAVIAAKDHDISMISKIFNVTRATLTLWIKAFKKDGVAGLIKKPRKTRTPRLNDEQLIIVERWLAEDQSLTIQKLCHMILTEMGVLLSPATAHRIIQKLKFSYITPRPRHYKQNLLTQEEFKKKSSNDGKG